MGERLNDWQDINYLLGWFGTNEADARQEYRNYIEAGVDPRRRPELVGSGLLRSNGDCSEVIFMDVGKGDTALIRCPFNQNILIDGGGIYDRPLI